jgi:hypothetical protein
MRCSASGLSLAASGRFWGSSRPRLAAGQSRNAARQRHGIALAPCMYIKDDAGPWPTERWRTPSAPACTPRPTPHLIQPLLFLLISLPPATKVGGASISFCSTTTTLCTTTYKHTPASVQTSSHPSASAGLAFALPPDSIHSLSTISLFRFPRPGTVERAVAVHPIASAVVIRSAIQLKVS